MDEPTDDHGSDHPLVRATSLLVVGAGLLALLLDYDWFWVVFALGFAVLVPLVKVVTGRSGGGVGHDSSSSEPRTVGDTASDDESRRQALDRVRDRYARGELSDEQFERKVARLLDTETLEDAREHVASESTDRESFETDDAPR